MGNASTRYDSTELTRNAELEVTGNGGPVCGWCLRPLPGGKRRDTVYCTPACKQAAYRFGQGCPQRARAARPLRLGYGDPPYPGKAHKYRGHRDFAGEVDHGRLIERLEREHPDGWALSTSADALVRVLRLCPEDVRVGSWHRGERPTKSSRPLSAWEPVIYKGGRHWLTPVELRRTDSLVHVSRPRTSDTNRVVGAKPARFCYWLFALLGALPGDDFVDLFPGSGGVLRAWRRYSPAGVTAAGVTARAVAEGA
jgi:hypothetical protein